MRGTVAVFAGPEGDAAACPMLHDMHFADIMGLGL